MTDKCTASKGCTCKISTGIHDGLTFGSGQLDDYGYWQIPCYHCARQAEIRDGKKEGTYWPWDQPEDAHSEPTHVEYLRLEADSAEIDGCPDVAQRFRDIADELERLKTESEGSDDE